MCNCKNTSQGTEEYFSAIGSEQPSQDSQFFDTADFEDDFISGNRFSSTVTPKSQRRPRTPNAPNAPNVVLRTLSRRPDLASGVAIAKRRLDFEDISEFDDETRWNYSSFGADNFDSSITNTPRRTSRKLGTTYELRRGQSQFPVPPRQHAPRMTRMTPCGKCLRI